MIQLSDPAQLLPIIQDVLNNNAQSIEDFKNGKDRAAGFLVGQIMKQTKGKSKPWRCKPTIATRVGEILK